MGIVGALALVANVWVALTLYRYRHGDSNMRSVWLCTRNDAINNIAVLAAAAAVAVTSTGWPDLAVGFGIATLELWAAWQVIGQAVRELRGLAPASAPSLEYRLRNRREMAMRTVSKGRTARLTRASCQLM